MERMICRSVALHYSYYYENFAFCAFNGIMYIQLYLNLCRIICYLIWCLKLILCYKVFHEIILFRVLKWSITNLFIPWMS